MIAPAFRRYIGIDYSGAETSEGSLKGLRIYLAEVRRVADARFMAAVWWLDVLLSGMWVPDSAHVEIPTR